MKALALLQCSLFLILTACNQTNLNTALIQDCSLELDGTAFIDECGKCVGGNTGEVACVQDCFSQWGGTAFIDECGNCVGGSTGEVACPQDCFSQWGGTAYLDECGQCVGGSTGKEPCVQDCFSQWGGTAFIDQCDECVGGSTGLGACRLVFVSQNTYTGNLSGILGADSKCQVEAEEAGFTGKFRAWVSDSTTSPSEWTDEEKGGPNTPFKLPTGSNEGCCGYSLVAESFEALTNTENIDLVTPINRNAQGLLLELQSFGYLWTGTNPAGESAGEAPNNHCSNWTDDNYTSQGSTGVTTGPDENWPASGSNWTTFSEDNCDSALRLYCVQVAFESP